MGGIIAKPASRLLSDLEAVPDSRWEEIVLPPRCIPARLLTVSPCIHVPATLLHSDAAVRGPLERRPR